MKSKLLNYACIAIGCFCTVRAHTQTGITKYGTGALQNNTSGDYNSAFGNYALYANTTGTYNTAAGYLSLRYNTMGNFNTAFGTRSLYYNSTGGNNTASGYQALYLNTGGYGNTATGVSSMYSNTTGGYNTATGMFSLYNNTTGEGNSATGYRSLYFNTTGENNTAMGSNALHWNTTGTYNSAIGYRSLYFNSGGNFNTAAGSYALYKNTSGNNNTAVGDSSLSSGTTGSGNTAAGKQALSGNITGFNNTAIGYMADVNNPGLQNATAIGYNAVVNANNKVRIGNTAVTSIGGQVGWTIFSDGRYKENIKENIPGLTFINRLRPVSYTVNIKALETYYHKGQQQASSVVAKEDMATDAAAKIIHSGFVAQEVDEVAKKLNYDFDGVDKPANTEDLYGLRYANFIVPLVKAVQELSAMNEEKDAKIEALQKQFAAQQQQIDELKAGISGNAKTSLTVNGASLEQNVPNPFVGTTTIGYFLPQAYTAAQIVVADMSGKTWKKINISGRGKGSITFNASMLAAGMYHYTLLVDGRVADSKQMLLSK